ncbi:NAD(P)-binding domain-containing protein [Arsenicibacter rosenii]|uniref:Dimethylaniline monooxygenase n=1 Tax=Arsenicibacter rosenii TaxID=1750698 RepID=A0A1S2VN81_9BACT|nr:NAD(P)-binding domain-containing protein [Arsenicibacter rosenii]OIN59248.1 hypothetical protein BLX24_09670 [Arsenicibacter rosenii]
MQHTPLLIVGAGPFGLALAAYLQHQQAGYLVVGKPMEFWQKHMPAGMYLRSGTDWHLDPDNVFTIERYAASRGESPDSVMPVSLEWYLGYTCWFMDQIKPNIRETYVQQLSKDEDRFTALLTNGTVIQADQVVLATGFGYFPHEPEPVKALLPTGRYRHAVDAVDMAAYRDKRVLLIGGRQSAFEWAALLAEAGAEAIHLTYRHHTPAFAEADWSWVSPLVDRIVDEPAWFRNAATDEQETHRYRLWAEGRLKVEPWLAGRLPADKVFLHPQTQLQSAKENPDHSLTITLSSGETFLIDDIILATGYQVNINRLPYLAPGLLAQIDQTNGFPQLNTVFESSVPGLYFSSFPAGNDFGPFFGFTIAVRAAAQVIGQAATGKLPAAG